MKHSSSAQLRKQAGVWLKELRSEAGLTQLELAHRLGFKYYPFISQVETGFTRVPTEKMEGWALALGVDTEQFALHLISFYEPELHRLLCNGKTRASPQREDAPEREDGPVLAQPEANHSDPRQSHLSPTSNGGFSGKGSSTA